MSEMRIEPEMRMPYLRVCLQHGGLYDDHPFAKDAITQLCHGREAQARWEGWDVQEWIRLCDCCLADTVRQGSRFSPFFCQRCFPRLREARRHGIPLGRHSLMNGIGMPPLGIGPFVNAANGMFQRIDGLHRWKAERVRQIWPRKDDPRLPEFLLESVIYADLAVFDLVDWWRTELLDIDF